MKLRRSYLLWQAKSNRLWAVPAAASAYNVIAGGLAWRKAHGNNPIPFCYVWIWKICSNSQSIKLSITVCVVLFWNCQTQHSAHSESEKQTRLSFLNIFESWLSTLHSTKKTLQRPNPPQANEVLNSIMDKTEISEDDIADYASYIDDTPEVRLENPIDIK